MNREAMKLALEAFGEIAWSNETQWQRDRAKKAITALKQALEQTEQEPVIDKSAAIRIATSLGWTPKREWQGLTDEEIDEGQRQSWVEKQAFESAVWWAEAKLKGKNT